MVTILLFPGYKMPKKRYNNFIDHIKRTLGTYDRVYLIEDEECPEIKGELYILAHSLGIIRSILYCQKYQLQPELIISMDGSYLNPDLIQSNLKQKEEECVEVYQQYLDLPKVKFRIGLFRQAKHACVCDESNYIFVHYYDRTGHYPYDHPGTRTRILNALKI